jgi:ATP-dependent RNA helicase DDX55/SPB4
VDTVIQYDPPTDPKTFSHRAGRTARAGRSGRGIVLLGKGREEDYVGMSVPSSSPFKLTLIAFLAARKMPLIQQPYLNADLQEIDLPSSPDQDAHVLHDQIRGIVLTDRELSDKAAKAFVSSMRAYTKHEASFIFRLGDLDFGALAIAFGLLRLPAMPEAREWRKRKEARRLKKEKAPTEAGAKVAEVAKEVEEVEEESEEDVGWVEADVDVSQFGKTVHLQADCCSGIPIPMPTRHEKQHV